jgi:hypothetical protein
MDFETTKAMASASFHAPLGNQTAALGLVQ